MTNRLSTQATAFGLAAIVTLMMLASIDHLATNPLPESTIAGGSPAAQAQVVVIEARRARHG